MTVTPGATPGTPTSTSGPLALQVDVRGMFDRIAPRYDAANRVMSAGIDILWRRRAMKVIAAALRDVSRPVVLDLGAGTLDGTLEILRVVPGARVAAADFARQMLRVGGHKLGGRAAAVGAHAADGHFLPYGDSVFAAAFSAFCVRNLTRLDVALAEVRRTLAPKAPFVVLEFFRPTRPRFFFDRLYNAHVLPLLGRAVSGDRDAYRYLPDSIARFLSRDEFEGRLRAAGFPDVTGVDLFPAGVASMVVAR